jgi:hypothetical protein
MVVVTAVAVGIAKWLGTHDGQQRRHDARNRFAGLTM